MKLKPQTTILLSTLFVFVGIATTMATGLWQTESDGTPRKLQSETMQSAQGQTGEQIAQYDPNDIRGSYTFGEISTLYGIALSDLATSFHLTDAEAGAFQIKTLKDRFADADQEVGTASVRMFVAYYLSLPYTPTEETWLTQSAVDILEGHGGLTEAETAYLAAYTLP